MIVIDIETTGQDPVKNSILSIGAIDFCNPKHQFYGECRIWDGASVEPAALEVNGFTRAQIIDKSKQSEGELIRAFLEWTKSCKVKTWAGMNPLFDYNFVKAACLRTQLGLPFAYRLVDLHTIAYVHILQKGASPAYDDRGSKLHTDEILKLAGLARTSLTHNALHDAKIEAEAISRLVFGKSLLEEFK